MASIVDVFSARSDNFGYLVHDGDTGRTAAIDAPEAAAIDAALRRTGWHLTDILITHHHADHTEAIPALKAAHGVTVTGPRDEVDKIAGLDRTVGAGDVVEVGSTRFEVLAVPGHTLGHIAFYNRADGQLFSGDALFSLGVGRMFEGTPGPMWEGLMRLHALPDDTAVYCGHEYTASNARFALHVDPGNEALRRRAAEVEALRAEGKFTIPCRLGEEKFANPFLRADQPELARAMGLDGSDPAAVFAALRKAKDSF